MSADFHIFLYICTIKGKMLEWLKRHAWKACSRLKRLTGSNPVLSAPRKSGRRKLSGFCL